MYLKAIKKDVKLVALIIIFIILAIVATMVANELRFVPPTDNTINQWLV